MHQLNIDAFIVAVDQFEKSFNGMNTMTAVRDCVLAYIDALPVTTDGIPQDLFMSERALATLRAMGDQH